MNLILLDTYKKMNEVNSLNEMSTLIDGNQLKIVEQALRKVFVGADTFVKNKDAYIFIKDESVVLALVRNICGLRFSIIEYSPDFNIFKNKKLMDILEYYGKSNNCDLMQLLIKSKKDFNVSEVTIPGYYHSNFVFAKDLTLAGEKETVDNVATIRSREKEISVKDLVIKEYLTRIIYPGSTVRHKDTLDIINQEYRECFASNSTCDLIFDGVFLNNDPNSYTFWMQDNSNKSALMLMFWVSPEKRGRGCGDKLIKATITTLCRENIKNVAYFVSVQNIAVIKLLLKNNFEIENFVFNKLLR